jgi:hypothetical protein
MSPQPHTSLTQRGSAGSVVTVHLSANTHCHTLLRPLPRVLGAPRPLRLAGTLSAPGLCCAMYWMLSTLPWPPAVGPLPGPGSRSLRRWPPGGLLDRALASGAPGAWSTSGARASPPSARPGADAPIGAEAWAGPGAGAGSAGPAGAGSAGPAGAGAGAGSAGPAGAGSAGPAGAEAWAGPGARGRVGAGAGSTRGAGAPVALPSTCTSMPPSPLPASTESTFSFTPAAPSSPGAASGTSAPSSSPPAA